MIKTGKRRFLKVLMLMVLMVPVSAWAQLDYGSQDDQYNQMNPEGEPPQFQYGGLARH